MKKKSAKALLSFFTLTILLSCNESFLDDKSSHLSPEPLSTYLNLNQGYKYNQFSGDEINPLIKENGDYVVSGSRINFQGHTIHNDSIEAPKKINLNGRLPIIKNAHPNQIKITENDTETYSNIDLTLHPVKLSYHDNSITNYIGKKIKTGESAEIIGRKKRSKLPLEVKALSPTFKDNSSTDLQYLDVVQGMSSSYVGALILDKNNNIWMGTTGGGISRYDGETFKIFSRNEGLNDLVTCLHEDKYENIWVGTRENGIIKYDGSNFTIFSEKEGLTSNKITTIHSDKSGNIWFGTLGGGLSLLKNNSIIHFTTNEGLNSNVVNKVIEDKNGQIWIATDNGVNKIEKNTIKSFNKNIPLAQGKIKSIEEDVSGSIWFGSENGLYKLNETTLSRINLNNQILGEHVNQIYSDSNGNLWFGTNSGVSYFDGANFTKLSEKEGLSNNKVHAFTEDSNGNIWIGTDGGGVCIFRNKSFKHFTKNEGLLTQYVMASIEDKEGNLWFGTANGLSKYDGNNFFHYTEEHGLINNFIRAIAIDTNGGFWIGTKGGLSYFDGKSFTNYNERSGLPNKYARSLYVDKNNVLWIGTNGGGLCKYDGKYFTHYNQQNCLSNNDIWSIFEDSKNNLWIGTNGGGVSKIFNDSIQHITEFEGLSNNHIRSISEDNKGDILLSTWNGLNIIERNNNSNAKIIYYTAKEGLSNNVIWSTIVDKENRIWISTEKGLNQLTYTKIKGRDSYRIKQFLKNDGLKGLDFYANSQLLDSKNRAWWGSGKSLTMLDLNEHSSSQGKPIVHLRKIDINGKEIDFRNLSQIKIDRSDVKPFENYPVNLSTPYENNHLTFHFSAIDWTAPNKITYSYTMEGLNESWSNPSKETKAEYRNLPYGKFKFKLRAIGGSGQWSEVYSYSFKIQAPWYLKWWAILGYAIVFTFFVYLLIRWRTSKLKERQEELEKEIEEATKEIRTKKEQIEEVHKEITDSINYAERIQKSFLATEALLNENLKDYFVYFQPKDIVSGDFYWAQKLSNGEFAIVTADSTGHGVPGAIMSILNITSIEKSIEKGISIPAEIFTDTRQTIIDRLKKDGSVDGGKDGMDASIISLSEDKSSMKYCAAYNPIWIIRNNDLIEIKPEKMPVGKHDLDHLPFQGGSIELNKGDIVYTITDGFQDQFGGSKGKKYKVKPLKRLLLDISTRAMQEQKELLSKELKEWKGNLEQVDDICIFGVKI